MCLWLCSAFAFIVLNPWDGSRQTKTNKPFQHLPLQEAVKVHAVLIVCKRSSTQVLVGSPGPTQKHQWLSQSTPDNITPAEKNKKYKTEKNRCPGESEGKTTHLRQSLKISLQGLSSRFSLHLSAKTSATSTRCGDCNDTRKHTWSQRMHTHKFNSS